MPPMRPRFTVNHENMDYCVGVGMIDRSIITCPLCGTAKSEHMKTDACRIVYECTGCGMRLRPKLGDRCVFCSYGSIPCPPVQAERGGKAGATSCCRG